MTSFRYFTDKAEVLLFVFADHTIKQLFRWVTVKLYYKGVLFCQINRTQNHLLHQPNSYTTASIAIRERLENKMKLFISGRLFNSTAEEAKLTPVTCYWSWCLIKKKTQTSPGIRVSICCRATTLPFGTQPSPKQSLWGLQHSQSGLLKCIAWQFSCTKMQGSSLDLDSWGVSRRKETHSTLINTWPHYRSHVAELRWGKFNTDLLKKVAVSFHVHVHLIMCIERLFLMHEDLD